jgi:hypothetical protein
MRGTPSKMQSDRGEQLVAASKQLEAWDFGRVLEWPGEKGIEEYLVPMGGQHFNGIAEQMIGIIKKQMQWSFEGR